MEDNERNFLASFQKASSKMIATNDNAYASRYNHQYRTRIKDYTPEEIAKIIDSGSLVDQQKLSRNYFYKDGYYRRILLHYATLLKYVGLLIPNPSFGKSLSTPHIEKRYYMAMDYVEKMSIPTLLTNCALKALVDGTYYGVIAQIDRNTFSVLDLPSQYCSSNYKDLHGNDLIEFDVSYFNTILNEENRNAALAAYPAFVAKAYRKWHSGKRTTPWVIIPSEIGICFPFFDGRPLFLNIIPATIEYDKAIDTEQKRDAEEIRKIIVQKIPHLQDGRLLFEPEEAEEIHAGTVGMLKGNENISVLTTYADVDAIVSKTSTDGQHETLKSMQQNIYANGGVSGDLFASTGSNTLGTSLKNDLALMMYLANKFSKFLTYALNVVCANSNISFKYEILPVSYYNEEEYVNLTFKMASSGYSALLPSIALGINQKDLGNIKDLENDVLRLGEKLRPLSSAYTQSGTGEPGRPKKNEEEKSDRTIQNEKSLDNQAEGGSE